MEKYKLTPEILSLYGLREGKGQHQRKWIMGGVLDDMVHDYYIDLTDKHVQHLLDDLSGRTKNIRHYEDDKSAREYSIISDTEKCYIVLGNKVYFAHPEIDIQIPLFEVVKVYPKKDETILKYVDPSNIDVIERVKEIMFKNLRKKYPEYFLSYGDVS